MRDNLLGNRPCNLSMTHIQFTSISHSYPIHISFISHSYLIHISFISHSYLIHIIIDLQLILLVLSVGLLDGLLGVAGMMTLLVSQWIPENSLRLAPVSYPLTSISDTSIRPHPAPCPVPPVRRAASAPARMESGPPGGPVISWAFYGDHPGVNIQKDVENQWFPLGKWSANGFPCGFAGILWGLNGI